MKHLNERGYALFLTILVLVLVSTLGMGLLTITANSNKVTVNERTDQSLYYIAETGINLEKAKILQTIEQIYNTLQSSINNANEAEQKAIIANYGSVDSYYAHLIENTYCNEYNSIIGDATKCNTTNHRYTNSYTLEQQFSKNPISDTTVAFSCVSTECTFSISSIGRFNNGTTNRELNQNLVVKLPTYSGGTTGESGGGSGNTPSNPLSNYGAITKGNIELVGGSKINGNSASLNGILSLKGGAEANGKVSVSDPSKFDYPKSMGDLSTKLIDPISLDINSLLPEYPSNEVTRLSQLSYPQNLEVAASQYNKTLVINNGDFLADNWITQNYTYNLLQDTRFKTFKVATNNTITLNIGNNNVSLYVDNLNIQQGHIKIQGSGTLNLYVKNSINIKGSFNNQQNANPAQLNIFYEGTAATTFNAETQIYGSYYSKTADLKLTGGAGFYGNIYSGGDDISISGGVDTDGQYIVAPNASLDLSGGGEIKGTVIVDNISGSGGTSITYGDPIIPLPTLPTYVPIEIGDSSSYIKELAVKEL